MMVAKPRLTGVKDLQSSASGNTFLRKSFVVSEKSCTFASK